MSSKEKHRGPEDGRSGPGHCAGTQPAGAPGAQGGHTKDAHTDADAQTQLHTREMTMWRHTQTSFSVYLLAHEQATII